MPERLPRPLGLHLRPCILRMQDMLVDKVTEHKTAEAAHASTTSPLAFGAL